MRSWKTPTPEQVNRVLQLTTRPAEFRYFLERLENPLWLRAFFDHGLFEEPLGPQTDDAAGTVQFPAWPLSEFLARVAGDVDDPELLLAVAGQIAHTKNIRVQRDVLAVAAVLPVQKSAQLTSHAHGWLTAWHPNVVDFLTVPLGRWMEHLAAGGEVKAAERLARQVLFLTRADGEGAHRWPRDLVGRLPPFWYGEFLKTFPALVRVAPEEALSVLLDVLDVALKFSSERGEKRTVSGCLQDYSTAWRHDISKGEPWSNEDYRQHLINALVAAMPVVLEGADGSHIERTIQQLEEKRWVIFHRIALHALSRSPLPESLDSVRARLLDQARLRDSSLCSEYDRLLAERSQSLTATEQSELVRLINLGPQRYAATEPTDEADDFWRYRHLRLIADHLDTDDSRELERLQARFGVAEEGGGVPPSGWVTDASPLDAARLGDLPTAELVDFLRTWQPPELGFPRPTRRALALQLEQAAQSSPQRFAETAEAFVDVHAEYQTALLRGVASAAEGGHIPEWAPLLVLCEAAACRTESDGELKRDLLRVLGTGFGAGASELPIALRETAWRIVSHLTHDLNPTPTDERSFVSPPPDPITIAINSVRGVALEMVVKYALWVSRSTPAAPTVGRSLDSIPEARGVLEERLDAATEETIAVRSVYGRFLPQLFWLDPEWTSEHVWQIFPTDPGLAELRDAAWESFVITTPAYTNLFRALRMQYEHAVRRLEAPRFEWHHLGDPLEALGRHLVTLYWRGELSLEDDLMRTLFSQLDAKRREDILAFAGRVLRSEETVDADILSRLQALWGWRRNEIEVGRGDASELCAFPWWFVSNFFDDRWAIAQLTHALSARAGEILFQEEIGARLARATQVPAADIVDSLEGVVDSDRWGVVSLYEGSAREILSRALEEGGRARERARALIDKLARLGHFGFADLLGGPPSQAS
jgi:hypothetical protein